MKKPLILFAACLTLAVAAKPGVRKLDYDSSVFGPGAGSAYAQAPAVAASPAAPAYRPCRPGRGDDNCIQLYESRVRAAYAPRGAARPAIGGPIEGPAAYPHCSRVITDECIQYFDRTPYRAATTRRAAPTRRPAAAKGDENTPGL
ncbi:MAG TPA: hypothetical protein VEZ20_13310 [Allosphingosinicella sp.]|jgi:hypothetical protein|nr:hypothetical protein [Allosphingosinicella sp.]